MSGRSKTIDVGPTTALRLREAGQLCVIALVVRDPVLGDHRASDAGRHGLRSRHPIPGHRRRAGYRASTSGDFSGCPSGARQETQSDFIAALDDCKAASRRCLFRRGDTFTATGTAHLDASAPAIVGAYGNGAKPLVDASHLVGTMSPPDGGTLFHGDGGGHDYRIMDLELKGPSLYLGLIYGASAVQSDVLFLRLDGTPGTWHAMLITEETQLSPQYSGWYTHMFMVESTISRLGFSYPSKSKGPGNNGANVLYLSWKESAILGNDFEDTTRGEHVIRAEQYDNLLIAHNRLGGAHSGKQVIALRSTDGHMMPCSPVCAPSQKAHLHANTLFIVDGCYRRRPGAQRKQQVRRHARRRQLRLPEPGVPRVRRARRRLQPQRQHQLRRHLPQQRLQPSPARQPLRTDRSRLAGARFQQQLLPGRRQLHLHQHRAGLDRRQRLLRAEQPRVRDRRHRDRGRERLSHRGPRTPSRCRTRSPPRCRATSPTTSGSPRTPTRSIRARRWRMGSTSARSTDRSASVRSREPTSSRRRAARAARAARVRAVRVVESRAARAAEARAAATSAPPRPACTPSAASGNGGGSGGAGEGDSGSAASGCGCRVGASDSAPAPGFALLFALGLAARRRRRA